MKAKLMMLFAAIFLVINVASAYSVRYYNKDSKSYKMDVRVNGSTKTIEFKASTASVSTSSDKIEIKTECGWIEVKNGSKIYIKNGCITIE